jgi:hypothetical protein
MDFLTIVMVISAVLGMGCLTRWFYLRYQQAKQQEEQKGFVVILTSLFLIWLFPGAFFLILALLILLMFLF